MGASSSNGNKDLDPTFQNNDQPTVDLVAKKPAKLPRGEAEYDLRLDSIYLDEPDWSSLGD